MRILAISLLRVGDLIMHAALFDSLQEQYPGAELHVLVNETSEKLACNLAGVARTLVFPRNLLQLNLVEENRPLPNAHNILCNFVRELNSNSYDLVINLTHNQLSARLMDLIEAKEKRGIQFANGERAPLLNNWMQYFNEYFSKVGKAQFHYIENLAESLNIKLPALSGIKSQEKRRICIQVLTSDEKKNWPLKNFIELISLLRKEFSEKTVTILGAPDEEAQLRESFSKISGVEFKFDKWSELEKTMSETQLLITGDTSVQHFAARAQVQVLSLFMGSANPSKTAPYLSGSVVIQTKAACSPCNHSERCWKSTLECTHEISVNEVFSVATSMLTNGPMPAIQNKLLKVQKRLNNRFHLVRSGGGSEMTNFQSAFEQSVWEIFMNRGHLDSTGPFGSFSHLLLEEYVRPFSTGLAKEFLLNRLQKCEMDQVFAEELHQEIVASIRKGSCFDSVLDSLTTYLISNHDTADYFYLVAQNLHSEDVGFVKAKNLSVAIQETALLLKIEHKLIRTLLTEMKEREIQYGTGFRAALNSGASAT